MRSWPSLKIVQMFRWIRATRHPYHSKEESLKASNSLPVASSKIHLRLAPTLAKLLRSDPCFSCLGKKTIRSERIHCIPLCHLESIHFPQVDPLIVQECFQKKKQPPKAGRPSKYQTNKQQCTFKSRTSKIKSGPDWGWLRNTASN